MATSFPPIRDSRTPEISFKGIVAQLMSLSNVNMGVQYIPWQFSLVPDYAKGHHGAFKKNMSGFSCCHG